MSGFQTVLDVRMLPEMDDQGWMLLAPLVYDSDVAKQTITVPAGFLTDFVSFCALKGKSQRPAVLHDFLTSCEDVSNELAASIFKEALESIKQDMFLTEDEYLAVLVFGASHHTNEFKLSEHSQPL